ncbi:Uncharacterised protein [Campylobacter hyointestinalis subsp. hyointestinalis]|uniref:Uncharacterized protein n=1 Tax=Campylobacter hyointestinalis subsp. hyointestinalis TaxID=91352 RepID=A0A0S4SXI0_CAMHY|nr:hypothetical protein [Campylobacter hyointestinalis]CUU90505.1 Uncharacterised protein [Campylobacter hyointestinalis subsp. hyointestinalis]
MESINKAKISDLADGAGTLLSSLGKILGVVKPALGTPIALAGDVLSNLSKVDDKDTKDIIGLSSTTIILDRIISDIEAGKKPKLDELQALSNNLKALDTALDKFYKIIS